MEGFRTGYPEAEFKILPVPPKPSTLNPNPKVLAASTCSAKNQNDGSRTSNILFRIKGLGLQIAKQNNADGHNGGKQR